MIGIWLEDQKLGLRDDLPVPGPGPGEALIRLSLAGICSTDLEMVRGYYPYRGILGHEFVGEVVAAPGGEAWVGRRVVGEINLTCGECRECRAGRETHCEQRTVLGIVQKDGAFAEYLTLPLRNLHHVPEGVSDESAVFTEPLAAALEILEQVQIVPTQRVLVVGTGKLGQLIARVIALTGCEAFALVRHDRQRHLLADLPLHLVDESGIEARSMDLVIEATGSPAGFELARQALRPRGTLVLKSTYHGELCLDISRIVVDEIQMLGSRCGPFAPALRLFENGRVDPLPLVDGRYSLTQGLEAFAQAAKPGVFKILLDARGRL
jgi:threonine dehydrogenase-like Zn-dependent dehydrogenase